jgi:hypothetical protein
MSRKSSIPQDPKSVSVALMPDTLDKAGEHFLSCGFMLEGHRRFKRDCSSN